jgi:hypothetical protein
MSCKDQFTEILNVLLHVFCKSSTDVETLYSIWTWDSVVGVVTGLWAACLRNHDSVLSSSKRFFPSERHPELWD